MGCNGIACVFMHTRRLSRTEDTCNYVTILQCLQRVTSSPHITASLLATPGWASTITAALQSASEAVAMEAARLLTRLWAPTMPRSGRIAGLLLAAMMLTSVLVAACVWCVCAPVRLCTHTMRVGVFDR